MRVPQMNDKAKSCCFSGHRSAHFDMDASYMGGIMQDVLKKAIEDAIAAGFATFHSGMAMGFDIIAAEMVIKQKYAATGEISLISVIPFAGQEKKWSKKWRERHDAILRAADKIIVLNPNYIRGCYHERNRYLVDNSTRLIGLWGDKAGGTKHTFDYAAKAGIEIINLWQVLEAKDPLMLEAGGLG
jgi:uncharacterized phage-like protein YoqJ